MDGVFAMMSYRDPPGAGIRTLKAYDGAVEWACRIAKEVGERVS
jgi:hypothetical protein